MKAHGSAQHYSLHRLPLKQFWVVHHMSRPTSKIKIFKRFEGFFATWSRSVYLETWQLPHLMRRWQWPWGAEVWTFPWAWRVGLGWDRQHFHPGALHMTVQQQALWHPKTCRLAAAPWELPPQWLLDAADGGQGKGSSDFVDQPHCESSHVSWRLWGRKVRPVREELCMVKHKWVWGRAWCAIRVDQRQERAVWPLSDLYFMPIGKEHGLLPLVALETHAASSSCCKKHVVLCI